MRSIINYAFRFLYDGMPIVFLCLPLYLFFRTAYISWKRKKQLGFRTNIMREFLMLLFAVYLMLLFTQTFIVNSGENIIKLVPFQVILTEFANALFSASERQEFLFNVLGNIAVFVPIGILCPMIWGGDILRTGKIGLFISVLIEVGQLPIDRTSDVDDLFLNTTGAVIGFCIWKFFDRKIKNAQKRKKNRAAVS